MSELTKALEKFSSVFAQETYAYRKTEAIGGMHASNYVFYI